MRVTLRKISYAILAVVVVTALLRTARAETAPGTPAPPCTFSERITELAALQSSPDRGSREHLQTLLRLRKDTLRDAVRCSAHEVRTLRTELNAPPLREESAEALRGQLRSQLESLSTYHDRAEETIENLGLQGSQEFARAFREWRASTHAPILDRTSNFLSWAKSQDLFRTAAQRFQGIERTLHALTLTENEAIQTLLARARTALDRADRANRDTGHTLEEYRPSDDFLAQTKTSFESLAEAYRAFFDISETVQTILPH